jgi:hypothetical protein
MNKWAERERRSPTSSDEDPTTWKRAEEPRKA